MVDRAKIAVLHPSPTPPPSAKKIIEEARKMGHKAVYIRPQEITLKIDRSCLVVKGSRKLEFDIAFIRGMGGPVSIEQYFFRLNVLRFLEAIGSLTINNSKAIELARDKLLTMLTLLKEGLPVPLTLATESLSQAIRFVEEEEAVVIKPIAGSMGRGVMLAKDPDVAYSIFRQLLSWAQPLVLQKYYEKRGYRDLRVLVINGEAYASYYRIARPGSFKTNLSQGARVEKAVNVDEAEELAIKATEKLELFYAGVDVMDTNDGYYILEVNASPNWRGAELLGYAPARKLVEEALKIAKT